MSLNATRSNAQRQLPTPWAESLALPWPVGPRLASAEAGGDQHADESAAAVGVGGACALAEALGGAGFDEELRVGVGGAAVAADGGAAGFDVARVGIAGANGGEGGFTAGA